MTLWVQKLYFYAAGELMEYKVTHFVKETGNYVNKCYVNRVEGQVKILLFEKISYIFRFNST